MGTVLALTAGLGLTVLGLGSADQAVASYDAASWVWSEAKSEVARINGITAKVDTRVNVPKANGHAVTIAQNDRFVILRDQTTGAIGTMDLSTLQEQWNQSQTAGAGLGVRVALDEHSAFVIDTVQGQVQQIDPATLGPIGQALHFTPGIAGGTFDGTGRLWIASPSEGTVTAITPLATPSGPTGGQAAASPGASQLKTTTVATPSHDLVLSTMRDGVAVLDRTTNQLTTIRSDIRKDVTLPLSGPGELSDKVDGEQVPVTVSDSRHVYVVNDKTGGRTDFSVPGDGTGLEPAVAWQGFFYVADSASGAVHVFDSAGQEQKGFGFKNPGGPLEMEVREGYLFINAPNSSTARVVDDAHTVRVVDKYADDILGGDPPKTPPTPPPPPRKPSKPLVSKPGPPRNVRAAAGNASATVSWQAAAANGAPIQRYVVQGAGKTFQVGADQRSLAVTGLTNGETYQFAVHAVNRKGDGPARTSNSVRPTSEVPDAPAAVTAEAKPDGTVDVSWPEANGQGLAISRYTVTAISEGGSAPIGDSTKTSLSVAAGQLEYGKQYAFTVTAVNEHGAGSKASPVSASVVPFTTPGKPLNLDASTDGSQSGAVKVAWQAPTDNGRPITKYVVAAGGKSVDVTGGTSTTLTGLKAGASVPVEVRAVNEAGPGEVATATAATVAAPRITVTGTSTDWNAVTVSLSVDKGGASSASCKLTASGGGGSDSGSCSSLKSGSLKQGTSYTFTVSATNVAGTTSVKASAQTPLLFGKAACDDKDTNDPATSTYCDKDKPDARNGDEIFSVAEQDNDKQVGWAKPGRELQAYCKKSGKEIDSYIYNDHKKSTWWIQVKYSGKNYIPWAWLNFDDDAATLGALPTC
jgi:predicted RNA-binding protein with TRAM domain